MESHTRVEIIPRTGQSPHLVRIGGVEFPVADFAVQVTEDGTPMLSLALTPDSIQIGTTQPAEPGPAGPKARSWGDGSQPDPRESIRGWEPATLSGQVAGHAEGRAFGDESLQSRLHRLGGAEATA